jgi:hypothetical protein
VRLIEYLTPELTYILLKTGGDIMHIEDLKLKARDLHTGEIIRFSLADLILAKDPPELHEEMDYTIEPSTP